MPYVSDSFCPRFFCNEGMRARLRTRLFRDHHKVSMMSCCWYHGIRLAWHDADISFMSCHDWVANWRPPRLHCLSCCPPLPPRLVIGVGGVCLLRLFEHPFFWLYNKHLLDLKSNFLTIGQWECNFTKWLLNEIIKSKFQFICNILMLHKRWPLR